MKKEELLKLVGSVSQIGGIKDYTFNDGRAKGVRAIEINTGKISITILPDRCMDVANATFLGTPLGWISKTGITAPSYYEKDGFGWLRGFYGGLITTCGLDNIGGPFDEYGLHGRIANTPASEISVNAEWVGDEYVMTVSGVMRDSVVFGRNLVLKRTYTAKLFASEFEVCDTVINDGFNPENFSLCYHCNFGYPLVREGAKITNVPAEISEITAPVHNAAEECIPVEYSGEEITTGIENGEIGAYITYRTNTLPDFLVWKMLGESEYVIGLEPRTSYLGGKSIVDEKKYVTIAPMEEYKTNLKFSFKKLGE